jgi:hypothetical protein
VISLDFELRWGCLSRATGSYEKNLHGARQVIPKLLELFAEYDQACTWATVGLLFFDRREQMIEALPRQRPSYCERGLSAYDHLSLVKCDEASDPISFGRSLIEQIRSCPRQEVATHTFSHYSCLDAGADPSSFAADLEAAGKIAADAGLAIESIVFPRNQVCQEMLSICFEQGLRAFRGTAPGWAYRAQRSDQRSLASRGFRLMDAYLPIGGDRSVEPTIEHGLVNVAASVFLRPYSKRLAWLEPLRLARIRRAMRTAARSGKLFHLWFHPHNFGVDQNENLAFLRAILDEAAQLDRTYGWPSKTMAEVASSILDGSDAQAVAFNSSLSATNEKAS